MSQFFRLPRLPQKEHAAAAAAGASDGLTTVPSGQERDADSVYVDVINYRAPIEELVELANAGDASAQLYLGVMYANGEVVSKDSVLAVQWFRKAAEQGNAGAQSNLGAEYVTGIGVPKDLVLAYMWRNLAAAQGYELAKQARDAMERDMTLEQIAEAQKLSTRWTPKQ